PRPERQDLLRLVRAADHDRRLAPERVIRQLAYEAALADPRLTEHDDDPTGPGGRAGQLCAEPLDLLRAPDELALDARRRSLDGGRRHSRRGSGRRDRSARALPQDLLVEDFRRRLGLDPELPLEHPDAVLVLAQGALAPARVDVEPHQDSVDRLLERIEREELQRGPNGRFGRSALALLRWCARRRARTSRGSSSSRSRSLTTH